MLGGGKKAKRFLDAMKIEISYEVDSYNRGVRITDGKLQDKFIECEKEFKKTANFLEGLPEVVKRRLQESADQIPPYKPFSHSIEPLIEQLRNFAQASETRAKRIKPIPGNKYNFLRGFFLFHMLKIYRGIYDELPTHTSKTLFYEVAKQLTELAKYPSTGLQDVLKRLKDQLRPVRHLR